jgi:thiol-disulfide isomerase/thioredoxin
LFLVAAAGCEPPRIGDDWRRVDPPRPAPDFTLKQLDGPPVSLAGLRGKVVVMEFWATWCAPCRFSLPSLEAIAKRYRVRNVVILLVNLEEKPDIIRKWTERRYTAPILLDADGRTAGDYGVESIPRLVIIDQAGRLIWEHQGYGGGLEQNLSLILDELLSPQPS